MIKKDIIPMPVTACIIVCEADEARLPRCLASLPAAMDVVVLKNHHGTEDTVPTLVGSEGRVKYYECTYTDVLPSFADLRNRALPLCKREWILIIDADEELIAVDDTFFYNLTTHYPIGVAGLMCGVAGVQPPYEKDAPALRYNEPQIRIFRNMKGIGFAGRCHEQIGWSIEVAGLGIVDCSLIINHHGYKTSKLNMATKMLRNTKLLALQFAEETDPHRARFFLKLLLRDGTNYHTLTKDSNHANG